MPYDGINPRGVRQIQDDVNFYRMNGVPLDQWPKQLLQEAQTYGIKTNIEGLTKDPSLEHYLPEASRQMMTGLTDYNRWARGDMPQTPDMVGNFTNMAPDYTPYEYEDLSKYYGENAPKYDQYNYQDYGKNFQDMAPSYQEYDWTAPEYNRANAEAYQFSPTNIEDVQDISGLPAEMWDQISRSEEEKTRQGWKGQRELVAQQLAREGEGRRGLGAALMANMASEEEADISGLRGNVAKERALQEVGIAQGTQALKAGRGVEQAALQSRMKEAQAAELARVQGISIDEARFAVDQQWKQQEAQAGEQKYGYEAGLGKAQYTTEQQKALDAARSAEGKYGYEQGTANTQFMTGLKRQADEDTAAERARAYEAQYGKAQDVTGLMGTQHQQEMSDWGQQGNALLSGAQLAQGATSQAGTYNIQRDIDTGTDKYNVGANLASNQLKETTPTQNVQPAAKRYGNITENQTKQNAQARSQAAKSLASGGAYA